MAEVLVVGSESYGGTQAQMNTALSTTIGGVTLVVTADNSIAGVFARNWAVANGIPFLALGQILPGIGYDTFRAPLAALFTSTPTNTLTAGTNGRVTAAVGHANAYNKTLTQI